MPQGSRFIDIHEPILSIDSQGNLLVDTTGKLAGQEQAGNVPVFGGKGIPTNVGISNAIGTAANISLVTFQLQDLAGSAVAGYFCLDVWLSDSSAGAGLTATAPSSAAGAASAGGAVLGIGTTKEQLFVQTNSAGAFIMSITDTAKTNYWPVALINGNPVAAVGAQLTSASYHT